MKNFFLLLILFPFISFAQFKLSPYYVGCKFVYANSKGDTIGFAGGGGFLVNEDYFSTCYHVYKSSDTLNVLAGYVYYNFQLKGESVICDTLEIDLNYKYDKSQFNFKTHKYDTTNRLSDFIVFKLKEKARSEVSNLNSIISTKENDTLHCFTLIPVSNSGSLMEFGSMKTLFTINYNNSFNTIYALAERVRPGYSGSPALNKNNQIAGIIVAGFEDSINARAYFNNLKKMIHIPEKYIEDVMEGYKQDKKLIQLISIDAIKKKYLSGFINQSN